MTEMSAGCHEGRFSASMAGRPLRLGFFTSIEEWGGSESYLLLVMRGMQARGHTVCCFGVCGTRLEREAVAAGIEFHPWKMIGVPAWAQASSRLWTGRLKPRVLDPLPMASKLLAGLLRDSIRIARHLRAWQPDVLHIGTNGYEAAVFAARRCGVPTLSMCMTSPIAERYWMRRWLIRLGLRLSSCVSAQSEACIEAWIQEAHLRRTRTSFVWNGADVKRFGRKAADLRRQPGDPFHLVSVGRLHPMKGHAYVIEALRLLGDRRICLRILGEGPEFESLARQIAGNGLGDRVSLCRHVETPEIDLWAGHAFILASVDLESGPAVLAEAMAAGLPLITSDFGPLAEVNVADETGLVVPMRDSRALARAILSLADNPELGQRMGLAGRERASQLLSVDRMLNRTLAIYEGLAGGGHGVASETADPLKGRRTARQSLHGNASDMTEVMSAGHVEAADRSPRRNVLSSQRGVLLIANVLGPCRSWTSEQQRSLGFRSHLPEYGWRLRLLVKRCQCESAGTAPAGTLDLLTDEAVRAGIGQVESRRALAAADVVRLACAPTARYRLWLRLAQAAGFRFATADDAAEVLHLVHPLPALGSGPAGSGAGRPGLLLLARLLGRGVARVHEQDRVDWVARGIAVGCALVKESGIAAVVGSFPSEQNIEIAAGIARRCGIPWVADFRDAVTPCYCCGPRTAARLAPVLRTAAAVTYATAGCAALDRALHGTPPTVIENGFLEAEIDGARRRALAFAGGSAFVLRFLGTLYAMRNLDTFLAGYRLFTEREPALASRALFEYYGPSAREAEAAAVRLAGEARVAFHGPVPAEEALTLTAAAQALVLPTNTVGYEGMAGAKFYEYLGCRRPILAAGGPDAYVADALARTGAGVLNLTPEAVAATLGCWLGRWDREGSLALPLDEAAIQTYSRRWGARTLAGVLDGVLAGGAQRGRARDGGRCSCLEVACEA